MPKPERKPFDVVVFGATSFVGQLLAQYLFETYGLDGELRWAAAGRSREKLEAMRRKLGRGAGKLDSLLADASRPPDVQALCRQGRVIVSTVGPYALYGEPLVQACVESGTDYCDLTGEPHWIHRMLTRYESAAQQSGARIVHCCGFDSIPSDLGVHFLQGEARRRFGRPCTTVKMRVRTLRGGYSGGTAASGLNAIKEAAANPQLRRQLADPYVLWTGPDKPKVRQHTVKFAEHDPDFDAWTAPFVMSAINTRIVHRSNMLAHTSYGREFRYDEAVLTGRGLRGRATAAAIASALGAFVAAGAFAPTRALLERFVLLAPGEGPDAEARRRGSFDLRFHGRTDDGRALQVKVTGDRDPGYGSTAKMLGQAAACLAQDASGAAGGFWTPATLLGDRLIVRLRAAAGLTFEVIA